jgi:exosortase C (VPDSG-CTERM-specific)
MIKPEEAQCEPVDLKGEHGVRGVFWGAPNRLLYFVISVVVASAIYWRPLLELLSLAGSSLYSHVPLVPAISIYLAWVNRGAFVRSSISRSVGLMLVSLSLSVALVGALWVGGQGGWELAKPDRLFLSVSSYVLLIFASGFFFLGRSVVWTFAFPLAVLFFMAPFPKVVESGIETFFQYASADAAAIMLALAGAPVYREGLIFHLPALSMEVGPECSGIRSSLVLLITSLVAGYLFLRSRWKRAALAVFVIPLAILRNGFRIFTIGMLCIHVDPDMINSWIHKRGGPLFFALSLLPFFGLLIWLRRSERARS